MSVPLPEPKQYIGVDNEPDFTYYTADQMHAYAVAVSAADNAALREDAEQWGNALNEAAWEFIKAYQRQIGQPVNALLFNNCKTILRNAILTYLETVRAASKGVS